MLSVREKLFLAENESRNNNNNNNNSNGIHGLERETQFLDAKPIFSH